VRIDNQDADLVAAGIFDTLGIRGFLRRPID